MKKIINPWEGLDGYMCFGCAPNNPLGLHMEFFEDGDDIVAFWKPQGTYQGWLRTLHGGIQTTLMDELAGWVVLRRMSCVPVPRWFISSPRKNVRWRSLVFAGVRLRMNISINKKKS